MKIDKMKLVNASLANQRLAAITLVSVLLVGCAAGPQPSRDDRRTTRDDPQRSESVERRDAAAIPNQGRGRYESKPAVLALMDQADLLSRQGDRKKAAVQLDRALRIDPRDPRLLQARAEVYADLNDHRQAEAFAVKSYQLSARSGPLCERNWDTIEFARRSQGNRDGARDARSEKGDC